jgi:hypothetical protein
MAACGQRHGWRIGGGAPPATPWANQPGIRVRLTPPGVKQRGEYPGPPPSQRLSASARDTSQKITPQTRMPAR